MDSPDRTAHDLPDLEQLYELSVKVSAACLNLRNPSLLDEETREDFTEQLYERLYVAHRAFGEACGVSAPPQPATLPILELADAPTAIIVGNPHHERAMQAAFARE